VSERDKIEYGSPLSDINDTPGFSFTEDKLAPGAHAYGGGGGLDKNGDKEISRSKTGTVIHRSGANAGNENAGVSSIVKGYGTPHQIAYLCVVLLQTISTAALVSVVWAKIRDGTPGVYALDTTRENCADSEALLVQSAIMASSPSSQEITTRLQSNDEQSQSTSLSSSSARSSRSSPPSTH